MKEFMTVVAVSFWKLAGCASSTLMSGYFAMVSLKPCSRLSVRLRPATPSMMTTLPLPPICLAISSAAMRPAS